MPLRTPTPPTGAAKTALAQTSDVDHTIARALQAFETTFRAELSETCDRMCKTPLAAALSEVRSDYTQFRDEVRSDSQRAQQQVAALSARMDELTKQVTMLTASVERLATNTALGPALAPGPRSAPAPPHVASSSRPSGSRATPSGDVDVAALVMFQQALASKVLLLHVQHLLEGARSSICEDAVPRPSGRHDLRCTILLILATPRLS